MIMFSSTTSANAFTPDSPILFQMECDCITIIQTCVSELARRFNRVSDELTFSASANDVAPES